MVQNYFAAPLALQAHRCSQPTLLGTGTWPGAHRRGQRLRALGEVRCSGQLFTRARATYRAKRQKANRVQVYRVQAGGSSDDVSALLAATDAQIVGVDKEIQRMQLELDGLPFLGLTPEQLERKDRQLREEKKQLRGKERQLRDKELLLLKKQGTPHLGSGHTRPHVDHMPWLFSPHMWSNMWSRFFHADA